MSNIYVCALQKTFVGAYADSELELSPSDYLYCDSEAELKEAVEDDLNEAMIIGYIDYDYSESEVNIPDEFIEEWKRLKKNEASSL